MNNRREKAIVVKEVQVLGGKWMKHSREELCCAIEGSLVEALVRFYTSSPIAVLRDEGDMILFSSGAPVASMNGVLCARFSKRTMARRTECALSFFRERGLPMTFFIGPSCRPAEIGGYLKSLGLVLEASPGMAVDLDTIRREPLPTGVMTSSVEDMTSLGECARIFAEVMGEGDKQAVAWRRDLTMAYGISSTRRWLLGLLDGKPVATGALLIHKGVAGIYAVATMEEARGRGIGTAVTRELLLAAKDSGCDFAVLQASKMGLPVYEKLGFRDYCRIEFYSWSPK